MGHTVHSAVPARGTGARAVVALVALVGAEASAVAVLARLGASAPFDLALDAEAWVRAAPVDALAAALRWVALVTAAWLLAVTVASVVATAVSGRGGRRRGSRVTPHDRVARVAPRAIRHLVERALVGGLAIGAVTAPGLAHATTGGDPPVVTVVRDGRAGDLTSLPGPTPAPVTAPPALPVTTQSTSTTPTAVSFPVAGTPSDAAIGRTGAGVARSVVVAPGEHLWELAARAVADARGVARDAVADADVAPYWVAVCDLNRDRVASGDMDLVYPGETILLPPLT